MSRERERGEQTYDPRRSDESRASFPVEDISHAEVVLDIHEQPPAAPDEEIPEDRIPRAPEESNEPEEHRIPRVPEGAPVRDSSNVPPRSAAQDAQLQAGIRIIRNSLVRPSSGQFSYVDEPSVARKGRYVFYTGNWYAAISSDGGDTWAYVSPYQAFDPQPGEPRFCCDQVVVYVPQIDMFVWSLQSVDFALQKILYARPADAAQGRWRRFNLNPNNLGVPGGELDYVDMAAGTNMLYWTVNVFSSNQANAVAVRIPLESLRQGNPAPRAWQSSHFTLRLAQGCEDVGYFASHNTTSNLRVYAWAENANEPTFHDVDVPPWRYGNSGVTWLEFDDSRLLGGARLGNEVWFSWNVNSRSGRPFPFAQVVRISTQNFTFLGSADIWQQNSAVGYAALAGNSVSSEVGTTYTVGLNAPSNAVGILTGTPVHQTTVQGSPTNVGRWGDYLSIRQDYDDAGQSLPSFAATGYALNQNGATLPHFIEFARQERVDFQEGSEEREANLNADALTSAAERLLNSLMHKLQTGANKEDKLFGDLGLIDFQITAGGITLHLRIASKECCKGS